MLYYSVLNFFIFYKKRGKNMSDFVEAMKNMIDDIYNVSITENGAVGYKTTT